MDNSLVTSPAIRYYAPIMKKLTLALAVSGILWAVAGWADMSPMAAPKIVCEESSYDFGEALSSTIVEHDYVIRNDGDLSLEIKSVRASCGCTAVNASQDIVPPGQSATIHARLDLSGRSGTQLKTITVTSNDPRNPSLQLLLKGSVAQPVTVNPVALYFGRLSGETGRVRTVEISSSNPITVTSFHLSGSTPGLDVEMLTPASIEPTDLHTFQVTVTHDALPGAFHDTLVVETSSELQPTASVPLTGFVAAP